MSSTIEDEAATQAAEPVAEPKQKKNARLTTFHVCILQRDEQGPIWRQLAQVDAINQDSAIRHTLTEKGVDGGTLIAVPSRSWKPTLFTVEKEIRYVKGVAKAS